MILALATALAAAQAPTSSGAPVYTLSPEAARQSDEINESIRREMDGPVRLALRTRCGRDRRCARFVPRALGGRAPTIPLSMLACTRAPDAGHPMRCVIWVGMGEGRQPIYCGADFREVAGPARWTDRAAGASTLRCSRNLIEATA